MLVGYVDEYVKVMALVSSLSASTSSLKARLSLMLHRSVLTFPVVRCSCIVGKILLMNLLFPEFVLQTSLGQIPPCEVFFYGLHCCPSSQAHDSDDLRGCYFDGVIFCV